MIKHKEQRVGVLVDVSNMYHSAKNLYHKKVNFKNVLSASVAGRKLVRSIAYVVRTENDEEVSFFEALSQQGFEVETASNWKTAEKIIFSSPLDVILLDVQLPGKNGIEILKVVKSKFPMLEVVVFSGQANIELAVEAIKQGAFDFIEKSYSIEKVTTIIENALKIKELKEENLFLKKISKKAKKEITGNSDVMKKITEEIMIAAKSNANVFITGENGTGKQLVAEYIHFYSPNESGNFVDINCAAIPENLLESELFGYDKGAFTGAVNNTKGKFELADHGTLFLDEIGELPLLLQAKLLKVLESRCFNRLGSTKEVNINARLISATNIDVEKEIEKNQFRKDLFYRLNVIHIHLPPLRDRKEDIPLLIEGFLKEIGKLEKKFSVDALELLLKYHWPGNVRELRNIVERAVIMTSHKKIIEQEDLEKYIQVSDIKEVSDDIITLKEYLNIKEQEYIARVLKKYDTQKEAANALNLERTVLYRKIKKYNIKI